MSDATDDDADARLHALWLRQIGVASAAFSPPARIREMDVTPELLADYRGHEVFLRLRARHPPSCFARFDDVRSCLIRRVTDEKACAVVLRNYTPCAREARKVALAQSLDDDGERRRLLNAKARVMEGAVGTPPPPPPTAAARGGVL